MSINSQAAARYSRLGEACYAELYFVDKLWPDFGEGDLDAAMADFARRQRRFGLTATQLDAQLDAQLATVPA